MLPSLLARDIQTGLKQFLISAFEPADAFNHGLMSRFVQDEEAWLKCHGSIILDTSIGGSLAPLSTYEHDRQETPQSL